jgi:hypothetical protein
MSLGVDPASDPSDFVADPNDATIRARSADNRMLCF